MTTVDMSNASFDGDRPAEEGCDDELVAACFSCPCCGERRMDQLEWNKAGTVVTCSICTAEYDPCEV